MAQYKGPVCKLCRREGGKLFLKGDRCMTVKCAFERRPYVPGEHGETGLRRRGKVSNYARQLREKQKTRRIYGVLERQFHAYYKKATRKKGVTGENLLQFLERRLDNLVYRAGFGASRPQARQIVQHGHILVNDRRVGIPSFLVKPGDRIGVHESLKTKVAEALGAKGKGASLAWLSVDREKLTCTLLEIPKREGIPTPIQEQQIIELYSK